MNVYKIVMGNKNGQITYLNGAVVAYRSDLFFPPSFVALRCVCRQLRTIKLIIVSLNNAHILFENEMKGIPAWIVATDGETKNVFLINYDGMQRHQSWTWINAIHLKTFTSIFFSEALISPTSILNVSFHCFCDIFSCAWYDTSRENTNAP